MSAKASTSNCPIIAITNACANHVVVEVVKVDVMREVVHIATA